MSVTLEGSSLRSMFGKMGFIQELVLLQFFRDWVYSVHRVTLCAGRNSQSADLDSLPLLLHAFRCHLRYTSRNPTR